MADAFPNVLQRLRRERGLNQRQTAADLHISQALLSHYENGLREPGLSFLLEVSAYFEVSVDFLLGRTPIRTSLPGAGELNDSLGPLAEMGAELLTRSAAALRETGDPELCRMAEEWFVLRQYELFRSLDREGEYAFPREMSRSLCEAYSGLLRARLFSDRGKAPKLQMDPKAREKAEELMRKLWEEWRELL